MGYSFVLVAALATCLAVTPLTSIAAQMDSPLYNALQAQKPLDQIIREEFPAQSHRRRSELKNYLLEVHWPPDVCDALFDVLGTTDRLDVVHWIVETLAARRPVQGEDEAHVHDAMVKFALRRRLPYDTDSHITQIARASVTDLIVQKRLPVLESLQLRVIEGVPDAPSLLARLAGELGKDISPFSQWLALSPDARMRETASSLAQMIRWPGRTDQQIRRIQSDLAEGPAKSHEWLHNIGLPFESLVGARWMWTDQQRQADPAAYARWIEFLSSLIAHESDPASMFAGWLLHRSGELSGQRRTDALARAYAIAERGLPSQPGDKMRAAVAAVIMTAETDRSKTARLVSQMLERDLALAAALVALQPASEVSDSVLRELTRREPERSFDNSIVHVQGVHRARVAPIAADLLASDDPDDQRIGLRASYMTRSSPKVQSALLALVERLPADAPHRIKALSILLSSEATAAKVRSHVEQLVAAQTPSSPMLGEVASMLLSANVYDHRDEWIAGLITSIRNDLRHPLRDKVYLRNRPAEVVELSPVEVARHLATVRQTAGTDTQARRDALGALYSITNPPSEVIDVLILTMVNPQLAAPRPPDPILPEESQRWFRSRRFDEPKYKQASEALRAWQQHCEMATAGGLSLRRYVIDDPSILERIERLLADHPYALAWTLIGLSEMLEDDEIREVTDLPLSMITKARDPLLTLASLPASDFNVSRDVPRIAMSLLSRLGATDPQVRKALLDAVLFGRESAPVSALAALARIRPVPSETHGAVSHALDSRFSYLAEAGAKAVGTVGDPEGRYTKSLIAIAKRDQLARYAAARALEKTAPNHPEVKPIIDEVNRRLIPWNR